MTHRDRICYSSKCSETDCVAGHVGLELRNVSANYLFERSLRFPEIDSYPGHRDYSRLSCDLAETQLGPGFCAEFKRWAAITAKAVQRLALGPARAGRRY